MSEKVQNRIIIQLREEGTQIQNSSKYFCHRNKALDLFNDLWSVEWGEVGEFLGMILTQ